MVQPGIRVEGGLKGFLGSLRHDKKTGPSTPFHAHNSAAGREGGGNAQQEGNKSLRRIALTTKIK